MGAEFSRGVEAVISLQTLHRELVAACGDVYRQGDVDGTTVRVYKACTAYLAIADTLRQLGFTVQEGKLWGKGRQASE